MIKNMIQAAIKMLDQEKPNPDLSSFKAKVECAKTILEEVVNGMKESKIEPLPSLMPVPMPHFMDKKNPPKIEEAVYEVLADQGRLVSVKGLKPDEDIILDGIKMKYKDAVGKTFQNCSIP